MTDAWLIILQAAALLAYDLIAFALLIWAGWQAWRLWKDWR